MAITFSCPHCAKVLKAPLHVGGKTIKCPACGRPSQVPLPQFTAKKAPSQSRDTKPAVEKPQFTFPWVGVVIGGILGFVYVPPWRAANVFVAALNGFFIAVGGFGVGLILDNVIARKRKKDIEQHGITDLPEWTEPCFWRRHTRLLVFSALLLFACAWGVNHFIEKSLTSKFALVAFDRLMNSTGGDVVAAMTRVEQENPISTFVVRKKLCYWLAIAGWILPCSGLARRDRRKHLAEHTAGGDPSTRADTGLGTPQQ